MEAGKSFLDVLNNNNMAKIYFSENQKVNLGWKWIFFISLYVALIWALLENTNPDSNSNPDLQAVIAISFSMVAIVIFNVLTVLMHLETTIDENKISVRFKPFHRKPKSFRWDEIEDFYIRYYKPVRDYGSYGIQRNIKHGLAYIVSGKYGLQLLLKSGKKVLIGTQKIKELERIVDLIKTKR